MAKFLISFPKEEEEVFLLIEKEIASVEENLNQFNLFG